MGSGARWHCPTYKTGHASRTMESQRKSSSTVITATPQPKSSHMAYGSTMWPPEQVKGNRASSWGLYTEDSGSGWDGYTNHTTSTPKWLRTQRRWPQQILSQRPLWPWLLLETEPMRCRTCSVQWQRYCHLSLEKMRHWFSQTLRMLLCERPQAMKLLEEAPKAANLCWQEDQEFASVQIQWV